MIRKLESGEYYRRSKKIAGTFFQSGFWSWRLLLVATVLTLAVHHSRGDDPKPNPPEVTAIIEAIRQTEELFRNMECAYTWEVTALPSGQQLVLETVRVILQGEWVHISGCKYLKDGTIPELKQQMAYDGKMTRQALHDASGKNSHGSLTFGKALPRRDLFFSPYPWVS